MQINKTALRIGSGIALLALAFNPARATEVLAELSYDTAGLQNTAWLVPGSVLRTDPAFSELTAYDMPGIPSAVGDLPYSTYLRMQATADAAGVLAVDTNMTAGGVARSTASWSDTIHNTSGASRSYLMNVSLDGVTLEMGSWNFAYDNRLDLRAGFVADILVNGTSVWRSAQTFTYTINGGTVSKEGVDLGDALIAGTEPDSGLATFFLGAYDGQVDLGSFADGESANVTYRLSTFSSWDNPVGCTYECARIAARASDVLDPGVNRIAALPVPEPETYAMLLGGLGLIGLRRRFAARPAQHIA